MNTSALRPQGTYEHARDQGSGKCRKECREEGRGQAEVFAVDRLFLLSHFLDSTSFSECSLELWALGLHHSSVLTPSGEHVQPSLRARRARLCLQGKWGLREGDCKMSHVRFPRRKILEEDKAQASPAGDSV